MILKAQKGSTTNPVPQYTGKASLPTLRASGRRQCTSRAA